MLCQGKVYYDLLAARRSSQDSSTALVRIEQLYPLARNQLSVLFQKYHRAKQVVWVQEEPLNMGAYLSLYPQMSSLVPKGVKIDAVGRKPSASPAVGSYRTHLEEQHLIMRTVFAGFQFPQS